jgi:hypothetical protein
MWAAYELQLRGHGALRLNHPLLGELTLPYEMFPLRDNTDQSLITYHAEPGSAAAGTLRPLASWAGAPSTSGGRGSILRRCRTP